LREKSKPNGTIVAEWHLAATGLPSVAFFKHSRRSHGDLAYNYSGQLQLLRISTT